MYNREPKNPKEEGIWPSMHVKNKKIPRKKVYDSLENPNIPRRMDMTVKRSVTEVNSKWHSIFIGKGQTS